MQQKQATKSKPHSRRTPMRALRAFCVAARHESFKLAAEELFVTASAISHQIKGLEEELDAVLFDRTSNSLTLTAAGKALFEESDPLLQQLDQVVERFRNRRQRQSLRISVQPYFASELFVPRLAEFTKDHPEIDLLIDTNDEASEKHPVTADISIRIFKKAPENLEAEAFYPLRVMPACSPELHKEIVDKRSGQIKPFPMILHNRRRDQWELWSESARVELPERLSSIELDSTVAVVNAARQNLGVAMIPMPLGEKLFTSGELVPLHTHQAATKDRYYFVCSPDLALNPAVRALRSWVLSTLSPPE